MLVVPLWQFGFATYNLTCSLVSRVEHRTATQAPGKHIALFLSGKGLTLEHRCCIFVGAGSCRIVQRKRKIYERDTISINRRFLAPYPYDRILAKKRVLVLYEEQLSLGPKRGSPRQQVLDKRGGEDLARLHEAWETWMASPRPG